MQSHINISD